MEAKLDSTFSKSKKEKYKLVFLEIENRSDLRKAIKKKMKEDIAFKKDIISPSARVITQVGTIFDHETYENHDFSGSGKVMISHDLGTPELHFSGGTSGKKTLSIDDKTIVSYQYDRICWDDDGDPRGLVPDIPGPDAANCDHNSEFRHPDYRDKDYGTED